MYYSSALRCVSVPSLLVFFILHALCYFLCLLFLVVFVIVVALFFVYFDPSVWGTTVRCLGMSFAFSLSLSFIL